MNIFSPFLIFPLRKFSPFRDYVYYKLIDRSIDFFDISIGSEELKITGMQPYKTDSSVQGGLIFPVILNRDFISTQTINHGRPQSAGTNTYPLSVLTFVRTHSANILNAVVSASYVSSNGFIRYVASNQPRFDYGQLTTNGSAIDFLNYGGLLIEPARANMAVHSTNFSSTSTQTNSIVFNTLLPTGSPAATSAPDSSTIVSIVSSNLSTSAVLYLTGCNTGVINKRYTISFFVKGYASTATVFSFMQHPSHQGSVYNFQLETGINRVTVISRSNPSDKAWVEAYPNWWYRICYTTVANANNARLWPGIALANTPSRWDNFYIWGLQIEEGDTPTSYIPVNGFTGVRGADILSLSGADLWSIYSSTPISNVTPNSATIYIESRKKYLSESPQTLLQLTNKDLNTYNNIIYTTTSTTISSNLFNTNLLLNVGTPWFNTNVKTAFSYNNISKAIALVSNGTGVTSTVTQNVELSGIRFGSNYSGHIRKIFIFPDSISLTDLKILTT